MPTTLTDRRPTPAEMREQLDLILTVLGDAGCTLTWDEAEKWARDARGDEDDR